MNIALLCAPVITEHRVLTAAPTCRLVSIPKAPIATPKFEIEILDAPPVRIETRPKNISP